MSRIQIENVSRKYITGDQFQHVLTGADLAIESGCFCALSGPSGSGKSTLLNMIGGIDSPDEGRVLIDGKDLNSMNDSELAGFRAQNIGFIFQSFHLIPVLTAAENVAWPLYFQGISASKRLGEAKEMLSQVGLSMNQVGCPNSCRAVSSSAWQLPVHLLASRVWCWLMNLQQIWTATHLVT